MKGYPPSNCKADRTYLPGFDPNAGFAFNPSSFDLKFAQEKYYRFFKIADKSPHAIVAGSQVDYGIDNLLTRAMIGHIAAAFNIVDSNTSRFELFTRTQQVFGFARPAYGDGRWMSEKQPGVFNFVAMTPLDEIKLQAPSLLVVNLPESVRPDLPSLHVLTSVTARAA
jgi:hypothetical protein